MGMFDLSKFLPLKEKDRPKGVITATGVESYEDFAKKELSEYHQHGTVSDLLGVIGLGGKASRDWSSSAAESFASEEKSVNSGIVAQSWETPTGVVRENFGDLGTVESLTEDEIQQSVSVFKKAFRIPEVDSKKFKPNILIHGQTVSGITPSTLL